MKSWTDGARLLRVPIFLPAATAERWRRLAGQGTDDNAATFNAEMSAPSARCLSMHDDRPTDPKPELYDRSMAGIYAFSAFLMVVGLILLYY